MMTTKKQLKEIADARKIVELRRKGLSETEAVEAVYGLKHLPYCGDVKRKKGQTCKVDVVVLEYQGIVDTVRAFGNPTKARRLARKLRKEYADDIERQDATVHELTVTEEQ